MRYPSFALQIVPEYTLDPITALLDAKLDIALMNDESDDRLGGCVRGEDGAEPDVGIIEDRAGRGAHGKRRAHLMRDHQGGGPRRQHG